jgi:CHASE2 domain-containing sensor protein
MSTNAPDRPATTRPLSAERQQRLRRLRRGILAIAAGTAALLALAAYSGHLFASLELNTIDTRFSIRGAQPAPRAIVIVAIDPTTVNALGAPGTLDYPFRKLDAKVIDRIYTARPRAIGVDLEFTNEGPRADYAPLIKALYDAPGTVLATDQFFSGGRFAGYPNDFGNPPGPILADLHAHVAATSVPVDSDGVWRRVLYSVTLRHIETLSFPVEVVAQATHRPVPHAEFPGGTALVDYVGPPQTFTRVRFLDVLEGRIPASVFRGKIVLIGATDPNLGDSHTTPVGPEMFGVEYWANAVSTILRGNPLRGAPGVLNVLLIVLLAVSAPLAALWLRPGMLLLAVALAVALVYVLIAQLAFDAGTVLEVVYPLLALVLGSVEATAADLWAERRYRGTLELELDRLPTDASASFFICYRREQSGYPANILRNELAQRFGESQVFMDQAAIAAGQDWPDRLERAVRDASVVLVLIGPGWTDAPSRDASRRLDDPADWVRREIEVALSSEPTAVVPVLLDGATMPTPEALPDALKPLCERQATVLSSARWSEDVNDLVESIRSGRIRDFLARERAAAATQPQDAPRRDNP